MDPARSADGCRAEDFPGQILSEGGGLADRPTALRREKSAPLMGELKRGRWKCGDAGNPVGGGVRVHTQAVGPEGLEGWSWWRSLRVRTAIGQVGPCALVRVVDTVPACYNAVAQ